MTAIGNKRWRVISPHLDRALDMATGERALWLSALQAEDPALAAELQLLLEEQKAICETHFLEHGPSVPNEAPSLAGQTLGAYTLESPLGEGGMGIVWLARRSDGRFEGKAAIKLLNAGLIGRVGEARFRREGTILGRITHPHVAHLIDAGVSPSGQPYLVLEYIEGEAIDRYCDAQALDVEERIRLFLDVLSAVAHAHTNLIVHRDLKPSNVLVAKGGNVKLLDFGIAKLLEDDPRPDQVTQLTREGRQALTPEYAAPEQVLGEPVTTATDVYALGVLLYVLLGGQHPAGDRTKSPAELIKSIVETQPPRLSDSVASTKTVTRDTLTDNAARRAATPTKLKRALQGDLDNIVAKALKKDPQERYATITALAEDLRRYLDHQPVSARPDSISYRTAKFVRRHRSMVAAGLLVVLAVAAGLAGTVTQARRAEAQTLKAHHERDRAQRELAGTEAMEEFMTFLLASKADKPFTVSELLLRGEALARQQFADDSALRARLLLALSNLTSELDEQDRTMALLHEAQSAAAGTGDVVLQAAIDCAIAADLAGEPDAAKAEAMFAAALKRVADGPDADRSTHAVCLYLRAVRALEAGTAQAAVDDSRAALDILGTPRPGQRTMALSMRMNLAGALAKSGDLPGAIANLKQGIDDLTAMGRGQTVGAVTFQNNLGVLRVRAGDPLGALEAFEKAVKIQGDTEVGASLSMNVAQQLVAVGRQQEAVALHERTRILAAQRGDFRIQAYGTVDFNYCPPQQASRCDQRLTEARRVLAGFLPPQHPVFGTLETTIAQLALARGDAQPAHAALLRAVAIFDSAPTLQPMRTRAAALLARTELVLGHPDAAAARAAEAVAQARTLAKGFAHSEWLGSALVAQGIVQQAHGEAAAAQVSWRAALTELQATVGDSAPATVEARQLLAGS